MDEKENELVTSNSGLEERIGADSIGNKIFVSELRTVVKYDSKGKKEEITFDNFIEAAESRISKGEILIKYDKESNRFYLVDNLGNVKCAHAIDINDEIMKDYAFGKFDYLTSKLDTLALRSTDKAKEDLMLQNQEETKRGIVAKIENTHEMPTPLEARIYLDYLKDLNKTNAKVVAKDASKIALTGGLPIATGAIVTGAAVASAPLTLPVILVGTAIAGLSAGVTSLIESLVLMMATDSDDFVLTQTFSSIKDWVNNIKEKIDNIKTNRQKQQELRKIDYVDKIVMPNSVTVEEGPVQPVHLQDSILNEMNDLIDRISLVNPEIRDDLLNEVRGMLDSYVERKTNITNGTGSAGIGEDSLVALRIDTCKKLASLEMQVQSIRDKDKKNNALAKETKVLTDKIDGLEGKTEEPKLDL